MEPKRNYSEKALEDFKLIDRAIKENDDQAFGLLLERYKNAVYHMILKMVRNVDDAEDLTMEAFAKTFKNLHKFKRDFTFSTWLFRIATNNAIDFLRKKRLKTLSLHQYSDDENGKTSFDPKDQGLDPQELAIKEQKIEIVRILVNKLPPKYRRLVQLRYFDELSYNEIAAKLDAPLGTIKAQLHRSRELMSELVKNKTDHL